MSNKPIKPFECHGEGCASDLTLDQYVLGELTTIERAVVDKQVSACGGCNERLEERTAGFAAMEGVNRDGMLAAIGEQVSPDEIPDDIRQALGTPTVSTSSVIEGDTDSLWQRVVDWFNVAPLPRLAGALAIPALALFLVLPLAVEPGDEKTPPAETPGVRIKGSVNFRVHRIENGRRTLVMSGDTFSQGDSLGFEVTLSEDGHILIVGVESDGTLYTSYPTDTEGRAMPMRKGAEQHLPKAVALDASQGTEWLHLVFCTQPFDQRAVSADPPSGSLRIPEGCSQSGFEMVKQ
jgi:hypothetical protein